MPKSSSDLLNSLRHISGATPSTIAQSPISPVKDAPKLTPVPQSKTVTASLDLTKHYDYAALRGLKTGFSETGPFNNYYFLSRQNMSSAILETDKGQKISFSGYNYLGLGNDPRVIDAVIAATRQYGTHAGAARMVGGEINLHRQLESNLADFIGTDDCVVSVGGYSTNVSVISYLLESEDLLIHDSYMHNSGVKGGILSQAKRLSFAHNDLEALEEMLKAYRDKSRRALILVEGAYSMDGDILDLPKIIELKKKYQAWLMVDEAHSIGVLGASGKGITEYWGVDPKEVDIIMGTLSKSFASCGGFIGGSQLLCDLLRNFAPGLLLYSTGISPTNTASAHEALNILRQEPERVAKLISNAKFFCKTAKAKGLDIGEATGETPIVPVQIGQDMKAMTVASKLFDAGFLAHPIIYPVVPKNEARIRFFITSLHTQTQIKDVLDLLAEYLG